MDIGEVLTCALCGMQFKALLESHTEEDCVSGLREENARLQAQIRGRTLVPELVELQRENARLRQRVEELERDALNSAPPYYRKWQEAEAKLARVVEAGDALEAHAHHGRYRCGSSLPDGTFAPCDCGLDDVRVAWTAAKASYIRAQREDEGVLYVGEVEPT